MPKYPNSSIYKLILNDEVYYGSTMNSISRRFYQHKYHYGEFKSGKRTKNCASYALFDKDFDNVKCELVELFPCDDRIELHKRERYYIENNPCVNKLVPTRTRAEYVAQHPDKIKASALKWREANKEHTRTRANTKVQCECGGKYTLANKSVHIKSKRHIKHGSA